MNITKELITEKRRIKLCLELNEILINFIKSKIGNDQVHNFNLISKILLLVDMNFNHFHNDCIRILNFYNNNPDLKKALVYLQIEISKDMSKFTNFIQKKKRTIIRNTGSCLIYNSISNQYEVIVNEFINEDDSMLDQLKCLVSKSYIEMFFYMMPILPENRFGVCPKCESPFFALTRRPKIYCSMKCSKAAAQEFYMAKNKTKG